MKFIIFLLLLLSLPSISYWNIFTKTISRDITIEYITYEIWNQQYKLKVGISNDVKTLSSLSNDYWAISGINGVFFCPADYSECGWKNFTINERFIDGVDMSFYPDTGERAVFWWDKNFFPFLYKTNSINSNKRVDIHEWLGNFPILYENGINMLEYYHDAWLYDKKMSASVPRNFICSNKDKTEIYFGRTSSTSLDNLAPALFDIWCWDGLNLDAWASSHFNYNGRELWKWSRKILDGFLIIPNWFNTREIHKKIDTAMPKIRTIFMKYPKSRALWKINSVREYIKTQRQGIYEKYSEDIFDKNWSINWYRLEVTDNTDLQKVYTLNIIDSHLHILYNDINKLSR